jgi:hypothetical protein
LRLQELRHMRETIPHFVIPSAPDESRRLANAASVPPEFIELSAVAVANQRALERGDAITPAEVRDLLSYATSYEPVADAMEALAQFIRHSARVARHKAGSEALITYSLAQRLAKRPATADLAPHVADMRRALGRSRPSAEVLARREAEAAAKAAAASDLAVVIPPAVK